MKLYISTFSIIIAFLFLACSGKATTAGQGNEKKVVITTNFGDIVIKLYDETPLHRDNFIKLANEGYYDDLLFHRVIKDFMIQGGDPESKNAPSGKQLGAGGPAYQIPAEIVKGKIHKKGALAAARQGDNANPERKSSGSQFYIVQGQVYDEQTIQKFEEQQKYKAVRTEAMKLYNEQMPLIQRLQQENKTDSLNSLRVEIQEKAEQNVNNNDFEFLKEQRDAYTTIGGTPHLDGAYTVFGEVIEGLDIIDLIAKVKTAPGDRPIEDIKMKVKVIE